MAAWVVERPGPLAERPLRLTRVPVPRPQPGEVLVRVLACGVCRTDLHVVRGDLRRHRSRVVPGHQIVGQVVAVGSGADESALGEVVGGGWPRSVCDRCRFCLRGAANLCEQATHTGWHADGGYGEFAVLPTAYSFPLPPGYSREQLAPLLCAGVSGYRALRRTPVARGGRLAVFGYGASAHLAAQAAVLHGVDVHVFTRSAAARELALELGALGADPPLAEAVDAAGRFDAAILFAPAADLVPVALRSLDRGGVLTTAGIHLDPLPRLVYESELFYERRLQSVTSNTARDALDFLAFAARHPLRVVTTAYPLDRADQALADLADSRYVGAAVLVPSRPAPGRTAAGSPAMDRATP
jgi:propanol-preferring alcohol dehydrogenase